MSLKITPLVDVKSQMVSVCMKDSKKNKYVTVIPQNKRKKSQFMPHCLIMILPFYGLAGYVVILRFLCWAVRKPHHKNLQPQ